MGIEMIISQLSIAPVGKDVSLSKYVKTALNVLKKSNVKFETNAMATVIETEDLETLFKVVEEAHKAVMKSGAKRVITELKIDDRGDKNVTMKSKLKSIQ
ncbi:MAG: MTH1187 family thiamine-binding protein [Desulfosporosinus sp.]|nr:MTH1187 family thiamine-binding protein [Desulfosporosinus sp.]